MTKGAADNQLTDCYIASPASCMEHKHAGLPASWRLHTFTGRQACAERVGGLHTAGKLTRERSGVMQCLHNRIPTGSTLRGMHVACRNGRWRLTWAREIVRGRLALTAKWYSLAGALPLLPVPTGQPGSTSWMTTYAWMTTCARTQTPPRRLSTGCATADGCTPLQYVAGRQQTPGPTIHRVHGPD